MKLRDFCFNHEQFYFPQSFHLPNVRTLQDAWILNLRMDQGHFGASSNSGCLPITPHFLILWLRVGAEKLHLKMILTVGLYFKNCWISSSLSSLPNLKSGSIACYIFFLKRQQPRGKVEYWFHKIHQNVFYISHTTTERLHIYSAFKSIELKYRTLGL